MTVDLGLGISPRYSLITLIFFIPYMFFQPPATVVLRILGPRIFLAAITLFWGVTMIGFGFVKDWTTMLGLRVVLGVFEAGLFPGCAYLLSTWYPRYELQKRNAVFYLIGVMISALTGILAYGISLMGGAGGLAGWRWIFVVSVVLSLLP
jgi:MFS family permease